MMMIVVDDVVVTMTRVVVVEAFQLFRFRQFQLRNFGKNNNQKKKKKKKNHPNQYQTIQIVIKVLSYVIGLFHNGGNTTKVPISRAKNIQRRKKNKIQSIINTNIQENDKRERAKHENALRFFVVRLDTNRSQYANSSKFEPKFEDPKIDRCRQRKRRNHRW
jgi:uncharacterized membrane protein